MKDSELLKNFKDRFNGTVLYNWQISVVLGTIGLEYIKKHLKEIGYRLVKIKKQEK